MDQCFLARPQRVLDEAEPVLRDGRLDGGEADPRHAPVGVIGQRVCVAGGQLDWGGTQIGNKLLGPVAPLLVVPDKVDAAVPLFREPAVRVLHKPVEPVAVGVDLHEHGVDKARAGDEQVGRVFFAAQVLKAGINNAGLVDIVGDRKGHNVPERGHAYVAKVLRLHVTVLVHPPRHLVDVGEAVQLALGRHDGADLGDAPRRLLDEMLAVLGEQADPADPPLDRTVEPLGFPVDGHRVDVRPVHEHERIRLGEAVSRARVDANVGKRPGHGHRGFPLPAVVGNHRHHRTRVVRVARDADHTVRVVVLVETDPGPPRAAAGLHHESLHRHAYHFGANLG